MKPVSILAAIFLIAFACGKSGNKGVQPVGEVSMKDISYRGGLVRFSIPSSWKEESDENGGSMFYGEGSNSGTLRLTVLTFKTPNTAPDFDIKTEVRNAAAKHGGEAIVLPRGNAMARYDSHGIEAGEAIITRFWQIYNRVNASHARIAVFSYTVPSSTFGDENHKHEMEMLDREISNARFATSIGELE